MLALAAPSFANDEDDDPVTAGDEIGKLLRDNNEGQIKDLQWQGGDQVLERVGDTESDTRVFAFLRGKYPNLDWSFTWNGRKIKREDDGKFMMRLPLSDTKTSFRFIAISPRGIIERETVVIYAPKFEKLARKPKIRYKRHFFTPGLSATYLQFDHNIRAIYKFSEVALTAKLGYRYLWLPPNWDVGISGFVTALPLSTTGPESIRFIGFNFRVGYVLPFVTSPWRVSIFAGTYYNTMAFHSGRFGYKNANGPQIYPTIERELNSGSSIFVYFKFSPVSNRFDFLDLESREIAGGGGYRFSLPNQDTIGVALDYADFNMKIDRSQVSTRSFSLGVNYGF